MIVCMCIIFALNVYINQYELSFDEIKIIKVKNFIYAWKNNDGISVFQANSKLSKQERTALERVLGENILIQLILSNIMISTVSSFKFSHTYRKTTFSDRGVLSGFKVK